MASAAIGQIAVPTAAANASSLFAGFGGGVSSAFSLTLVTEFGDRTFFIAALLATKYKKWAVLIGALAALFIQSAFAATMGRILHYLPTSASSKMSHIPIDDYCAAAFLLVFAVIHLRAGLQLDAKKGVTASEDSTNDEVVVQTDNMKYSEYGNTDDKCASLLESGNSQEGKLRRKGSLTNMTRDEEIEKAKSLVAQIRSKNYWDTIIKSFYVIFAAELGDKSMIATIALATAQNPYGVVIGAMGGHFLVTLSAVYAGELLHGYISERIANLFAGVLFLVFGLLTLIEGLNQQGLFSWPLAAYVSLAMVCKSAFMGRADTNMRSTTVLR